jgi:hypothetical protein
MYGNESLLESNHHSDPYPYGNSLKLLHMNTTAETDLSMAYIQKNMLEMKSTVTHNMNHVINPLLAAVCCVWWLHVLTYPRLRLDAIVVYNTPLHP